jgi:hypothetical protein
MGWPVGSKAVWGLRQFPTAIRFENKSLIDIKVVLFPSPEEFLSK